MQTKKINNLVLCVIYELAVLFYLFITLKSSVNYAEIVTLYTLVTFMLFTASDYLNKNYILQKIQVVNFFLLIIAEELLSKQKLGIVIFLMIKLYSIGLSVYIMAKLSPYLSHYFSELVKKKI